MIPAITSGFAPFGEFETAFRVVGDIGASFEAGLDPLVLLHGGPGSTHNYFELLDPLAQDGRALVMYDQLGCGDSYVEGRPDLWHAETWVDELENLISYLGLSRMHLLGQSWGGMLAITYLCERKPKGVTSVVLSSTLPSSQLWGREQHRLITYLPQEDQDAIAAAEASGDFSGAAYLRTEGRYMSRHCSGPSRPEDPECLRRPKRKGSESYLVAWGPNEFTPLGTLADWDYTDRLCEIEQPALVISGTDDLCTPLIAKTMADRLPHSRWELFEGCRHTCFAEDTPRYLDLLGAWMHEHDSRGRGTAR